MPGVAKVFSFHKYVEIAAHSLVSVENIFDLLKNTAHTSDFFSLMKIEEIMANFKLAEKEGN